MSEINNEKIFEDHSLCTPCITPKLVRVVKVRTLFFTWLWMMLVALIFFSTGKVDIYTLSGVIWFPGWMVAIAFSASKQTTLSCTEE
jgi:hypothetical protein